MEPSQAEVLGYMARTGVGATDAARHFFPGASPDAVQKLAAKYRQWRKRYGDGPTAPAPSSAPTSPAPSGAPPVVAPRPDVAAMNTVARLEWQVERAAGGVEYACAQGDVRALSMALKGLAELGALLDKARAAQARSSGLDRGLQEAAERLNAMHDLLRRAQHARERSL